jgi:hypothetical protein
MKDTQRIYAPEPAVVNAAETGAPVSLDGLAVEAIREDWLVEDRWWTERLLHRHYYELVLIDGRDVVVFHELTSGRWYRQRA